MKNKSRPNCCQITFRFLTERWPIILICIVLCFLFFPVKIIIRDKDELQKNKNIDNIEKIISALEYQKNTNGSLPPTLLELYNFNGNEKDLPIYDWQELLSIINGNHYYYWRDGLTDNLENKWYITLYDPEFPNMIFVGNFKEVKEIRKEQLGRKWGEVSGTKEGRL